MNYIADLHNHTNASDGEYTPTELVQKGKALGLQAIGVTDHDTLNGLDEAVAAGEQFDIQVLTGVEVSLRFRRPYFTGTLHYLLYIPRDILADADFRAMATAVFQQGRGHGLVQARVDAINAYRTFLKVRSLPTMILFDSEGHEIERMVGYNFNN